jgi:putative membrane protein
MVGMNAKSLIGRMGAVVFAAAAYASAVAMAVAMASPADHTFVMKAAQGGMAEVADGKLAISKTVAGNVRAIAQRMVTDHSMANAKLATIAQSEGITLPDSPAAADKAMMAKQMSLSGAAFNASYLKGQVTAHQMTIALFKKEIATGSDPRLIAFAKQTLPTIQSHLMMITSARGGM